MLGTWPLCTGHFVQKDNTKSFPEPPKTHIYSFPFIYQVGNLATKGYEVAKA